MKKTYYVTNGSKFPICVTGRDRFAIPGYCQDFKIELPEETAKKTVTRLKTRYPLLKFREETAAETAKTSAKKSRTKNEPAQVKQDVDNVQAADAQIIEPDNAQAVETGTANADNVQSAETQAANAQ